MKNAPIMPPMMSMYLRAQNPFWIPARGSFEDLTLTMIKDINVKKSVTMKQSLEAKEMT